LVLVDTGVFVAAADLDTAGHARGTAVLREHAGHVTVPRFFCPVTTLARTVMRDVDLGGQEVRAR
jgi:predicted nucleic acid-binding protein